MNGDTVSAAVHLVAAGVWTGSLLFVTAAVLPLARDGRLRADPLAVVTDRLRWTTRGGSLLLVLTGTHLALTRYGGRLTGDVTGHAVLAMAGLWLVMTGLAEAGCGRLASGVASDKVRTPAKRARPLLAGASALGVALLALGAWLVT